jgi:hypothetical protein
MAENKPHEKTEQEIHLPDLNRPEVRHEESDVNVWAVGKFAIALVFLCGIALLLLAGLFKYFQSTAVNNEPTTTGINVDARRLPPQPRLQDAPILDLQEMKAAEDQILNGYGWVDQQAGIARIPISRAIDLLAQQGLPSRPQTQVTSASNATVPTESGMGYIMQQPGGPLSGVPTAVPQPPPPPVRSSGPTDSAMPGANPPPKYYEAPKK